MSGSPRNIRRDAIWTNPRTSDDVLFGTESLLSDTSPLANSSGQVNARYGCVQSDVSSNVSITAARREIIGVLMNAPVADTTPYRIHASSSIDGSSATVHASSIIIGYAPASPTGTDDIIEDIYRIPFRTISFDNVVMVPALESGDTYFGRALFIGISIDATVAIVNVNVQAHISVQNLGVGAPPARIEVP